MRYIVTCGCGDTESFAKDAFKILFKAEPLPPTVAHDTPNLDLGRWAPYISAADKAKEKYAYYVSDKEMWDLMKGIRLG